MVQIYCIEDINGLKYIGSTKSKLNQRLSHHKCCKKCMSKKLNLDDCKIYTLEECDDNKRKEREQYWIDNTECVNYQNTIFDRPEYLKKNRDKRLKEMKQYRDENKDKINEQQKNHYHYKCSWGGNHLTQNNLLKIDPFLFS
jgi:hypothetical protein